MRAGTAAGLIIACTAKRTSRQASISGAVQLRKAVVQTSAVFTECCSSSQLQKYLPLDLRTKKTRAIRRRLTKHQVKPAAVLVCGICTLGHDGR